ncbi:hypothetical protein [Nocardia sp. BMG111209]|uniref:hypothetical protein n=1 Tax=Nocardia sp. BMG111209 TaxID=1160137 RepID=UPI00037D6952|nr:hypothetical protein [Nocardia sp. BMG111209]
MKTSVLGVMVAGVVVAGLSGTASATPDDVATGSQSPGAVVQQQDEHAAPGTTPTTTAPPRRQSAYETPEGTQEMLNIAVMGSGSIV